ncbi:DUF292-domain-containing protein [Atractiella rhizophila]|nr:DUF292-domain-containing protein [Atractiella rhizophila]
MPSFNAPRTKIQIKLCLTRIKLLIQKKNALAKAQRRAIAQFLEGGKIETATIRTETIINDDLHVELLEVLELYLEVLTARFGLLETQRECDPGISDAVCGIIYAAGRTEMKELHTLREMLMAKFGREFAVAVMENQDNCVPNRVTSKLTTETPSSTLVDAYMYEIAKAYGVNFKPESVKEEEDVAASLSKPESVASITPKVTLWSKCVTAESSRQDCNRRLCEHLAESSFRCSKVA